MSAAEYGYIVRKPAEGPAQVGDPVMTYELVDPYLYGDLPGLENEGAYYSYIESIPDEDFDPDRFDEVWREESPVFCPGRSRKGCQSQIGSILVHRATGRRWGSFRPERPPAAFRDSEPSTQAMPLPKAPGGRPRPLGVTSCPKCGEHWLCLLFPDRVELLGVRRAVYDAEVAPAPSE